MGHGGSPHPSPFASKGRAPSGGHSARQTTGVAELSYSSLQGLRDTKGLLKPGVSRRSQPVGRRVWHLCGEDSHAEEGSGATLAWGCDPGNESSSTCQPYVTHSSGCLQALSWYEIGSPYFSGLW
ncbi:hypothetical protein H1C71_038822 [Ictidomys tridecemlineatus]|nr:hypothetical protein H1C71_038822 [Ictidomys tridecemlineatus]